MKKCFQRQKESLIIIKSTKYTIPPFDLTIVKRENKQKAKPGELIKPNFLSYMFMKSSY